jgi:hypothetical protein
LKRKLGENGKNTNKDELLKWQRKCE